MKLITETDKAEYKWQIGLAAVLQHSDIDVWIHARISEGWSAKLFINLSALYYWNYMSNSKYGYTWRFCCFLFYWYFFKFLLRKLMDNNYIRTRDCQYSNSIAI